MSFQNVIGHALANTFDGDFLPQHPGDQDKGSFASRLTQGRERLHAAPARQLVGRQDDVKREAFQLRVQLFARSDDMRAALKPCPFQFVKV